MSDEPPIKSIDYMEPTLTLSKLEKLTKRNLEQEAEKISEEFGRWYYAMLLRTLHEGEPTARHCILIYQVNRFLELFGRSCKSDSDKETRIARKHLKDFIKSI